MSEVTVGSLAKIVGLPVDKLLKQLAEAGMEFSGPDQAVSSTEKLKLLGFLKRSHGKAESPAGQAAAPDKITLNRRTKEELTIAGTGKNKSTVSVEVRQKRHFIKRDETSPPQTSERDEVLRKLEESKSRNAEEQARLSQQDRTRREQLDAVKSTALEASYSTRLPNSSPSHPQIHKLFSVFIILLTCQRDGRQDYRYNPRTPASTSIEYRFSSVHVP